MSMHFIKILKHEKNQFSNFDLKILICPTIDSWYILQHQRLQTSLYCARPVSWSRKECEMYEDVNYHIYLYNNKIYTAIDRKMTYSIRAMGKLGTYSIYQDFVTDIMKLPANYQQIRWLKLVPVDLQMICVIICFNVHKKQ